MIHSSFLQSCIRIIFILLLSHSLIAAAKSPWINSASSVPLLVHKGAKSPFSLSVSGDPASSSNPQLFVLGSSQRYCPSTSDGYSNLKERICYITSKPCDENSESSTQNRHSQPGRLVTHLSRGGGIFERTNKWIGSSPKRCWISLSIAIAIEICATTMMKIASDENCIKRRILSSAAYLTSLLLFGSSLAQIDVGVAYAIWSALGTLCVSVAGVTMFGEECTAIKVLSMILILIGVVGLNFKSQ